MAGPGGGEAVVSSWRVGGIGQGRPAHMASTSEGKAGPTGPMRARKEPPGRGPRYSVTVHCQKSVLTSIAASGLANFPAALVEAGKEPHSMRTIPRLECTFQRDEMEAAQAECT